MTWIPVAPGTTPATQRTMLVTTRENWNVGNGQQTRFRVALAMYVQRFMEECDIDGDVGEYRESDDTYYWPEGWYECSTSHPDHTYWPLGGEVVAIQKAPKPWLPETNVPLNELSSPEPAALVDGPIAPCSIQCPACRGTGIDTQRTSPECCGNGTVHGCCGDPVDTPADCELCLGDRTVPLNIGLMFIEQQYPDLHRDPPAEGGYTYPCNSCSEHSPIYCDITEFHPDGHYCYRNQYCCP